MRKNQKGFLIALCLCMLSLSGVFGVYQYRKGLSSEPQNEVPKQNAQAAEQEETEKEAANSRGAVAQADTKEKEAEQAKIDTEQQHPEFGHAFPTLLSRFQPYALHDTHNQRKADRQGNKQPVDYGSESKLPARPIDSAK